MVFLTAATQYVACTCTTVDLRENRQDSGVTGDGAFVLCNSSDEIDQVILVIFCPFVTAYVHLPTS